MEDWNVISAPLEAWQGLVLRQSSAEPKLPSEIWTERYHFMSLRAEHCCTVALATQYALGMTVLEGSNPLIVVAAFELLGENIRKSPNRVHRRT